MDRKHSSRRVLENRIRSAVERETPDLKEEIMARLKDHGENAAVPARRRAVWKYAVSFAAVAIVVGGALILPKTVRPAETAPGGSSTLSTGKQAQQNPFTLTAYAAEKAPVSSGSGKTLGLTLTRPVSVAGIDCSGFAGVAEGRSIYDTLELLKDDGTTQFYAKYVGFNLKCVGEHIQSVTFTADRGGFAQIKNLTPEEYRKISDSIPYVIERQKEQKADYEQHPEKYNGKPVNPAVDFPVGTPNPDYGDGKSMEIAAGGWGDGKEKEELDGFLPVGSSYTVSYAEQDDYRIQYALRLPITFSKKDVEENWDMRDPNHRASKAIAGTVVTITAAYEDGSTAQKQCVLTLDPDTWIFTAVEK